MKTQRTLLTHEPLEQKAAAHTEPDRKWTNSNAVNGLSFLSCCYDKKSWGKQPKCWRGSQFQVMVHLCRKVKVARIGSIESYHVHSLEQRAGHRAGVLASIWSFSTFHRVWNPLPREGCQPQWRCLPTLINKAKIIFHTYAHRPTSSSRSLTEMPIPTDYRLYQVGD